MDPRQSDTAQAVKQCCARLYESDLAKFLLGDSFHPGGLALTRRLGELLQLRPESRVLDDACGKGTSAVFLAETFGCEVIGVDYSDENVAQANELAVAKGLASRVHCQRADAEQLPFAKESFDAVVCECAFCTFPNKTMASWEFARVLREGGRVGLSDMTRLPDLPRELDSLLAWIACIADAQPVEIYEQHLRSAGLKIGASELHDEALLEMAQGVQGKLLSAEILIGLKKINVPGLDITAVKQVVKSAIAAIQQRRLGYMIITAEKPA